MLFAPFSWYNVSAKIVFKRQMFWQNCKRGGFGKFLASRWNLRFAKLQAKGVSLEICTQKRHFGLQKRWRAVGTVANFRNEIQGLYFKLKKGEVPLWILKLSRNNSLLF